MDNAKVQEEKARLKAEWDAGCDEGYAANPAAFPFFFYKPYTQMTARQRGYVFGREIKLQEIADDTKGS